MKEVTGEERAVYEKMADEEGVREVTTCCDGVTVLCAKVCH